MIYSTIEVKGNVLINRHVLIKGDVLIAHGGALMDRYDGDYIVTPRTYEQSLDTDNKYLTDDVTVLEIPKTVVSNPNGGYTVTIG